MIEIKKNEKGFYYMSCFIEYISKENYKNYIYGRYLFNKQGNPIQDVKSIIEENGSIVKYGKNCNVVINPICVYFAICMVKKENIKEDISFYNDILRDGFNASDEELFAFKDFLEYGRNELLDDFQILSLFLCVVSLYRQKEIFNLNVDKRYFTYFKGNNHRNINQRIYNLLKSKGNFSDIKRFILQDKG